MLMLIALLSFGVIGWLIHKFVLFIKNEEVNQQEYLAELEAQEQEEERQWEYSTQLYIERRRREQERQDKRQEEIMKRAFLQAIREYDEEQNGSLAVSKANSSPSETSTSDCEGIVSTKFSGSKTS